MPTKMLTADQHRPLHDQFGQHDCCLCRADNRIAVLEAEQRADRFELECSRTEARNLRIDIDEKEEKLRDSERMRGVATSRNADLEVELCRVKSIVREAATMCRQTNSRAHDAGAVNMAGRVLDILDRMGS